MLRELYIENLAVIEKADVRFCENLNVFTGETGAGKSILIGGINAVLGHRVSRDIVRGGCEKAVVTAVFDSLPEEVGSFLRDGGIDMDDGQIVIAREVFADGGSSAHINSRPVSAAFLREVGSLLVNIHGQHDNQALLSQDKHLEILDRYGELEEQLNGYKEDFKSLQTISREIKRLATDEREKSERIKLLAQTVNDIAPLELSAGEDEELERRFRLAELSQGLTSCLAEVNASLYGSDEAGGASMSIARSAERLKEYQEEFSDIEELVERLDSLRIELDDVADELIRFSGSIEIGPHEYERLSRRRDDVIKLKRKYNTDAAGLVALCEKAASELMLLQDADSSLEKLNARRTELLKQVSKKAAALSEARSKAAKKMCEEVAKELEFLNMEGVKLSVKHTTGKLTVNGMDSVELLISANAGEQPKPIAKIASGGELSRIMLALKNVIAGRDGVPTLVFDEIDTGVSGRAAQKIGIKLHQIARVRQVLCVTHLTQIAVYADNHLMIEKASVGDRTAARVVRLDRHGRVEEIARLLGGENVTETTLKNADELISAAQNS